MSGSAVTGLYNHPLVTACRIHTWCIHSAILGIIDRRFRNEGAEAYNKNLSKRCNMFNSSGNRGSVKGRGNVLPFVLLRY